MRILICEDDPIHSMNLEMIFEDGGHEVVGIYGRADQALLHCWRNAPDLAVVDLRLADGTTGLSMVRALDGLGIPSIIVSAEADFLTEPNSARAVIAKPYHEKQLLDALEMVDVA